MEFLMTVTEKGAKKLKRLAGAEFKARGKRAVLYKALKWATPVQPQMADKAMTAARPAVEPQAENAPSDLDAARADYEQAFGEPANRRYGVARLRSLIANRYQTRDMRAGDLI
jgi:hypothetical protein